jgi:RNA polymerase sigma-70 factor (ECF subfamily)
VARTCLDEKRRRHPLPSAHLESCQAPARDQPAKIVEARELAASVRGKILALPETQRLAVILRYYRDCNYAEIADALQVTSKAVENLLRRARATLSQGLAQRSREER